MSCNCIVESGFSISNCLKWADQCPHSGKLDVGCKRKRNCYREEREQLGLLSLLDESRSQSSPTCWVWIVKKIQKWSFALLTADWQFQRPADKERGAVKDVEIGCRLAGFRCRLRVMLECGWKIIIITSKCNQNYKPQRKCRTEVGRKQSIPS